MGNQQNSRNWKYPGKTGYDVTSNMAATTPILGGRYDHSQGTMEGLYGKTLNQFLEDERGLTANALKPMNSPWKALDDNSAVDSDVTWGYNGLMGATDIGNYHTKLDSSWELGTPTLSGQENHRWFQGSAANAASSYDTDTARLSCFHCEVQYALKWDSLIVYSNSTVKDLLPQQHPVKLHGVNVLPVVHRENVNIHPVFALLKSVVHSVTLHWSARVVNKPRPVT